MCLQLFDGALYAMKRIRLYLCRKTVLVKDFYSQNIAKNGRTPDFSTFFEKIEYSNLRFDPMRLFFSFLESVRHVFANFRWCVTRDETDKALSASKNGVGHGQYSQNTAKN